MLQHHLKNQTSVTEVTETLRLSPFSQKPSYRRHCEFKDLSHKPLPVFHGHFFLLLGNSDSLILKYRWFDRKVIKLIQLKQQKHWDTCWPQQLGFTDAFLMATNKPQVCSLNWKKSLVGSGSTLDHGFISCTVWLYVPIGLQGLLTLTYLLVSVPSILTVRYLSLSEIDMLMNCSMIASCKPLILPQKIPEVEFTTLKNI